MGLDFSFSEEQEVLRNSVRELAQKAIAPHLARWDENEEMPWEAVRALGQAGLLGVIAPRSLGGQGMDYITLGIVIEELGRVDTSCSMICSIQNTLSTLTPGWDEELLRDVYKGRKLICIATSEEDAGSDISNIKTTARVDGDEFVISGRKIHVSLMPGANVMGVSAWVLNGAEKPRISFIQVPSHLPGISVEHMPEMGVRSHQLGIVNLRDVRVPRTAVLAGRDGMDGKGAGKAVMYARWNVSRCLSALNAIGGALDMIDRTIKYVGQKQVYGRPIGQNQAISFPLIEHLTRLESCRLLAYRGLWLNTLGRNAAKDATMSKWFGISEAVNAVLACMNMHGANGYLKVHGIERRLRDLMGLQFTGGTLNVMKIIAVGEAMGKEFMAIARPKA